MRIPRNTALGVVFVITFALMVAYQAVVPLYKVEIDAPNPLPLGAPVTVEVTAANRVSFFWRGSRAPIDAPMIELTLHQGAVGAPVAYHAAVTKFARFIVTIGPDVLRKFEPGPATLRVTINGESRWLRNDEVTTYDRPVTLTKW